MYLEDFPSFLMEERITNNKIKSSLKFKELFNYSSPAIVYQDFLT